MSTPRLNLCIILSESKRIIKAHSRHFLALSVIFLLPLAFSILVYPTLQQLILQSPKHDAKTLLSQSFQDSTPEIDQESFLLSIFYAVFAIVSSLCGVGSITYSVFHGFYGRPVKLISSLKSILYSFLPLLATTLVCQMIVSGILSVFAGFLFLVVRLVKFVGFDQFEYSSPYFLGFSIVLSIVLVLILVYLQVKWALAYVIVVLESSWGIKPLKRSAYLIKGYKLVALSMYLYYSFLVGILIWSNWETAFAFRNTDRWKSWGFVLQIVFTSTLLTLLFLYFAAANTVLYMYCKAIHGELAPEIAEEFAREYVRLPFDDEKVPRLVSVVYET
ncbi:Transmembrane protein [Melia azedarach]|uniref:Transmembrane protein n=1 Tax=Melia azedarach TaxID=155640 RepID=A0ACC1XIY5_MELAZ|nr:Transmembrane protein [Melia azedarach]